MAERENSPNLASANVQRSGVVLRGLLNRGETLPIGGGYRLVQRLGTGNFGQVWKAEAPGGKPVAVKILNWHLDHPATQRELQSLELIKKLNHPYLLDIHGYYVLEEALVIVMRLADGNLKERLVKCKADGERGIPPAELLRCFTETAEVLDYLHGQGIQHRDIKPENLLLCQGHVALGDLGLARLLEGQQVQASVLGTPPYMAPEVWRSQVHNNSDQYSLAITYLELRCGKCPFANANTKGLLAENLQDYLVQGCLKEAESAVLLKAGAREPQQRYASCEDFLKALRTALDSGTATPVYRKAKLLGKGRFGDVWKAEAPGGIPAAVKVIKLSNEYKLQSEFKALELTKQLAHPYLIKVFAYWLDGDELNIAMELADRSLQDRFEECRRQGLPGIPRGELIEYLWQSAQAVDFLHENQVLHRDLKPENILLQGKFAKVGDFGVARLIQSSDLFTATTSGTMAYMPPEAWYGKYSVHSDQYSLAVTYVRLCRGRHLFEAESLAEAMQAHLHKEPDLSGFSDEERHVLRKALAKDAQQRFGSCLDFAEALRRAQPAADAQVVEVGRSVTDRPSPTLMHQGTFSGGTDDGTATNLPPAPPPPVPPVHIPAAGPAPSGTLRPTGTLQPVSAALVPPPISPRPPQPALIVPPDVDYVMAEEVPETHDHSRSYVVKLADSVNLPPLPSEPPASSVSASLPPQQPRRRRSLLVAVLALAIAFVPALAIFFVLKGNSGSSEKQVQFRLTTSPAGASVTFLNEDDGEPVPSQQQSSDTFLVAAKKQRIRVEMPGYQSEERSIDPTQQSELHVTLLRLYTVDVLPETGAEDLEGATVALANKELGTLPLKLSLTEGTHTLLITPADKKAFEKQLVVKADAVVRIKADETTAVAVKTPQTAAVAFNTDPPGARVIIDKAMKGITPLKLDLKPGKYELQLIKEGHETRTESIVVKNQPGATQDLQFKLQGFVWVHVQTAPPGAKVRIDGMDHGQSPAKMKLSAGEHKIELAKDDFASKTEKVTITGPPGSAQEVFFSLQRLPRPRIEAIPASPGGD